MVWIPDGTFRMGSGEFYIEERPVHKVAVTGFWIDRYPVTNEQFARFVAETGNGRPTGTSPDTQPRWSNRATDHRSILGSSRRRKATTRHNPSSVFLARLLKADRFFALPIIVCV